MAEGYTKVGYSKWHPIEPCFRYPDGIKRLHRLEFSIKAFGLGELKKWSSEFHSDAREVEREILRILNTRRRSDVGTSREVFDISHLEAVSIVRSFIPGCGSGDER